MADKSAIEWTDATWTPIRAKLVATATGNPRLGWHCEHASEGCRHCYAESMNRRLGTGLPFKPGHRRDIDIFLDEKMLTAPLRWKRPRKVFVCSMTDIFAAFITDEMLDRMFDVMEAAETDYVNGQWVRTPTHTYQILTKRSDRMRAYMAARFEKKRAYADAFKKCPTLEMRDSPAARWARQAADPDWYSNLWFGASVEDRNALLTRAGDLRQTPAAKRFFSCEPLIDDLGTVLLDGIDWVICGGESGRSARPMHPAWARSLRDQCVAAGVPFFFKQWGEHIADPAPGATWKDGSPVPADLEPVTFKRVGKKAAGRLLDGVEHNGMPA